MLFPLNTSSNSDIISTLTFYLTTFFTPHHENEINPQHTGILIKLFSNFACSELPNTKTVMDLIPDALYIHLKFVTISMFCLNHSSTTLIRNHCSFHNPLTNFLQLPKKTQKIYFSIAMLVYYCYTVYAPLCKKSCSCSDASFYLRIKTPLETG